MANMTGDVRYIYDLLSDTEGFQFCKAQEYFNYKDRGYKKTDVLSFVFSKGKNKRIIFFGSGNEAKKYYSLFEAAKINIDGIIDNNLKENNFHGIPVYLPEKYAKLKDSIVIITSSKYCTEMYWEMIARGVEKDNLFLPGFNALISFNNQEYFDRTVWGNFREHEVFVDAGAYDMDTSIEFINHVPNFEKIYAFEPDEENYEKCKKKIKETRIDKSKILLFNSGLWSEDCELCFKDDGGDGNRSASHIDELGDMRIKACSLDTVLQGEPCSFIKMDIEGAEYMALQGAKETILKHKPRLAICLYHKPMDLIDIPIYIHSLVPEYRIKIRHYSTCFVDTIMYAYID